MVSRAASVPTVYINYLCLDSRAASDLPFINSLCVCVACGEMTARASREAYSIVIWQDLKKENTGERPLARLLERTLINNQEAENF